jgi:hypothetical protein
VSKQGSRTSSLILVQPIDSIPPSKPVTLKGTIDSPSGKKFAGIINKEKTLLGYRIYKAYNASEEYSQLTVSPNERIILKTK